MSYNVIIEVRISSDTLHQLEKRVEEVNAALPLGAKKKTPSDLAAMYLAHDTGTKPIDA